MGFLKKLVAGLAASLLAQAILISLGGGGAVVSTVVALATDASPLVLVALGVSVAMLLLGAFGAYVRAHPPRRDEKLREFRRERIARWRSCLDEARAKGWEVERHGYDTLLEETSEYAELDPLLTAKEREAFEKTLDGTILYKAIARLEREWGLG